MYESTYILIGHLNGSQNPRNRCLLKVISYSRRNGGFFGGEIHVSDGKSVVQWENRRNGLPPSDLARVKVPDQLPDCLPLNQSKNTRQLYHELRNYLPALLHPVPGPEASGKKRKRDSAGTSDDPSVETNTDWQSKAGQLFTDDFKGRSKIGWDKVEVLYDNEKDLFSITSASSSEPYGSTSSHQEPSGDQDGEKDSDDDIIGSRRRRTRRTPEGGHMSLPDDTPPPDDRQTNDNAMGLTLQDLQDFTNRPPKQIPDHTWQRVCLFLGRFLPTIDEDTLRHARGQTEDPVGNDSRWWLSTTFSQHIENQRCVDMTWLGPDGSWTHHAR
ncbi:hypothetical protein LTR67_001327 [Exophiala xenobiotica]